MSGSIRVLVVDDERIARRAVTRLLRMQPDFQVVGEATNGLDAIREVARLTPEVVLMDVTMPTLNGVDATKRILAEFPSVKVVAYSTHDSHGMAPAMLAAGAVTYLEKSMPVETLAVAIRSAVEYRKQGEA